MMYRQPPDRDLAWPMFLFMVSVGTAAGARDSLNMMLASAWGSTKAIVTAFGGDTKALDDAVETIQQKIYPDYEPPLALRQSDA